MLFATPLLALDDGVQDGLKWGCLFAYLPDENIIYFKIDLSRRRLLGDEARAVETAPIFSSKSSGGDSGSINIKRAMELGRQCSSVSIRVMERDAKSILLETTLPVKDGMSEQVSLNIVKLKGAYEVHFTLNGLPEPVTVTKTFERQVFPWEGNTLGITGEVYPPFEPVNVKGNEVSVVERRYTMNGFGLWDNVVTKDRDILTGPITLRYLTAAGEGIWQKQTVTKDEKNSTPQKAVFTTSAESGPVCVSTTSTIEFDGCMKVEMDLLPGDKPAEISKFWIDIPLKDREAPLFHEMSDYIRKNFAGSTPKGEGVVWNSTKSRRTAKWQNPFTSYVWLGAEERGLCWFAENDRGWITAKGDSAIPLQEIIREGDLLTLRIYLVNKPSVITEKHSLVFGMQASPVKPMPENWRSKTTTMPGGSGPVNPWGGLHCGYKGPYHNDWQIVDKIIEAQKTGVFDEAWFKAYVAKYNPPPPYGNWDWFESVRYFSGMRRRPVMTYQEELIQSVVQPEWLTFQDEWRNAGTLGTEMSEFTQREWSSEEVFRKKDAKNFTNPSMYINYCASYRDYGCWYANEWFKRGISAYWDNTFPKYTYNTRNSAAYVTEDGHVQPAMVIWNEREYIKRVWNLLQYWRRNQSDQLEWSHHMTNALILPLNGFATVILDYELNSRIPFPPEMHRAEAIGRQVGAIPYWLFTPTGSNNPFMKDLLKKDPRANDLPDWGMKMVHEALRTEYTGGSSLKRGGRVGAPELEAIVVDFGYTKADTKVYNYWDEQPALSCDNDQVKWIVMSRPEDKALLIVLQSWTTDDISMRVTLNGNVLGFTPGKMIVNAETNQQLSIGGGVFSVDLPGPFGTRLIKIQ